MSSSTRRFEYRDNKSSKFWEIDVTGSSYTVRFGRIGTNGQTKTKDFGSESEASHAAERVIREKVKKGYEEISSGPSAPPAASPSPPAKKQAAPPAKKEVAPKAAPPVEDTSEPLVRWTDSARRKLEPIRPSPYKAPSKDAFARLSDAYETVSADGLDESKAPEAERAWMLAVRAASESPPERLDVDVEGARAALLGFGETFDGPRLDTSEREAKEWQTKVGDALLDFWISHADLAFAVRALVRSGSLRRRNPERDYVPMWLESVDSEEHYHHVEVPPIWRGLRRRLNGASEPDYEKARSAAADLRASITPRLSCLIAYAFVAEAQWIEDEVRAVVANGVSRYGYREKWLWASLTDVGLAEKFADALGSPFWPIESDALLINLLHNVGPDAIRPFAILFERAAGDGQKLLAEMILLIESEEAAEFFAAHAGEKYIAGIATNYFERVPRLAIPALSRAVARGGATAASFQLQNVVSKYGTLAEELAESLPAEEADAIRGAMPREEEEASADELPPVLSDLPWERKHTPPKETVLELEPHEVPEKILWDDAKRKRVRTFEFRRRNSTPESDVSLLAELERERKAGGWLSFYTFSQLSDTAALKLWNETPPGTWRYIYAEEVESVLGRFEHRALPGLLNVSQNNLRAVAEVLEDVCGPGVPKIMARAFAETKVARGFAISWLRRFPREAALELIPVAVGRAVSGRESARQSLRFLAGDGHDDVVRAVAKEYGEDASREMETVLSFDPLMLLPKKIPKLPAFWSAPSLSRPRLRESGRALPLASLDALALMLAMSRPDEPYAGVEQVAEVCDEASLGAFAWSLFESWRLAGTPPKEAWAFHALGHLGDDAVARQLTPLLREWPSQGQHARAVQGLDILARIGSDVSLMHLHGISQKVKSRSLQEHATEKMEAVAERLGLTAEELADRLVPDLGLDPDGSRVLDFGPRTFRVGFDEQLKPFVQDESGKRRAALPKPAKSDDATKAERATTLWKSLKKDARAVATHQIARLERAMCAQRRWAAKDFQSFLVEHPLMIHLVRRLVWAVFEDDRIVATFRVAEDRSLADVDDGPVALSPDTVVGLPHRLEIATEVEEQWARLLGDYEILQPFLQLGRAVYSRKDEADPARAVFGVTVNIGYVLGLERRGWHRGETGDGGVISEMVKPLGSLPHEYQAELEIEPGIWVGMVGENPEQKLGKLWIQRVGTYGDHGRLSFDELDDIAFSELLSDVHSLKGG